MADKQSVTTRFHDLPLAAQLVVWATRHWLSAFAGGRMIPRSVWQSFAVSKLDPAYGDLVELLAMLAGYELLPSRFEQPNAPRLASEEYRFVRFIMSGGEWPFDGRPCPPIVREATARAERLALRFEAAGYRLALPENPAPFEARQPPVMEALQLH